MPLIKKSRYTLSPLSGPSAGMHTRAGGSLPSTPLQDSRANSTTVTKKRHSSMERDSAHQQPPKKRKIGKNNGSGEDNQNDYFCWQCHREGSVVCCELCPRVYHTKCLGLTHNLPDNWVCPECEKTMRAECIDTRSKAMSMITLDQLCQLLRFALKRMLFPASEPFQRPVDQSMASAYSDYIFNPIDLRQLEKNIKQKMYGSTEAFLADTKWIQHNCIIFNGSQNKLSSIARSIVKICKHEMNEIEICPDCYLSSCVKQNEDWFCEPCRTPHTLVWAKLKGYPFWPAKALRESRGQIDVRFFGAHDRSWVPVSQVFLLSKVIPTPIRNRKSGFDTAMNELKIHIANIRKKFGSFEYAQFRTPYDRSDAYIHSRIKLDQKPGHSSQSQVQSKRTMKLPKHVRKYEVNKNDVKKPEKIATVTKKAASALKIKYNSIITTRRGASKLALAPVESGDKNAAFIPESVKEISNTEAFEPLVLARPSLPITKLNTSDIVNKIAKTLNDDEGDLTDQSEKADNNVEIDTKTSTNTNLAAPSPTSMIAAMSDLKGFIIDGPTESSTSKETKLILPVSEEKLTQGQAEVKEPNVIESSAIKSDDALNSPKTLYQLATDAAKHSRVPGSHPSCPVSTENSNGDVIQTARHRYKSTLLKTIESCKAKLNISDDNVDDADEIDKGVKKAVAEDESDEYDEKFVIDTDSELDDEIGDGPEEVGGQAESALGQRDEIKDDKQRLLADNGDQVPSNVSSPSGLSRGCIIKKTLNFDPNSTVSTVRMSNCDISHVATAQREMSTESNLTKTSTSLLHHDIHQLGKENLQTVSQSSKTTSCTSSAGTIVSTSKVASKVSSSKPKHSFSGIQFRSIAPALGKDSAGKDNVRNIVLSPVDPNLTINTQPSSKMSVSLKKTAPLTTICPSSSNTKMDTSCSTISTVLLTPSVSNTSVSGDNDRTSQLMPIQSLDNDLSIDTKIYESKISSFVSEIVKEISNEIVQKTTHQATMTSLRNQLEIVQMQHKQEILEIKHNLEVNITELKSLWEKQKQEMKNELIKNFEEDKASAILDTKKKQWCAYCFKEAIFYCCWNTSYCDYPCQIAHWPTHMANCTQTDQGENSSDTTTAANFSTTSQNPVATTPQASWNGIGNHSEEFSGIMQSNGIQSRQNLHPRSHTISYIPQGRMRQPMTTFSNSPPSALLPQPPHRQHVMYRQPILPADTRLMGPQSQLLGIPPNIQPSVLIPQPFHPTPPFI